MAGKDPFKKDHESKPVEHSKRDENSDGLKGKSKKAETDVNEADEEDLA